MSEEKRRKKRLSVNRLIRVRVIDITANRSIGKLANLHEDGFMVITEQSLIEEDNIYQLLFEDDNDEELFRLGAECLWLNASVGDQYWAGFQIIDVADAEQAKVTALIELIQRESLS